MINGVRRVLYKAAQAYSDQTVYPATLIPAHSRHVQIFTCDKYKFFTPSIFCFVTGPFGAPAAGLFGAPVASTGTVSLFGGAATQPAFGSAFGTPFGTPQQPQQPAGFGQQQPAVGYQAGQFSAAAASLVTTDGKPLSHATKWEEISAQGQAYLLELE